MGLWVWLWAGVAVGVVVGGCAGSPVYLWLHTSSARHGRTGPDARMAMVVWVARSTPACLPPEH